VRGTYAKEACKRINSTLAVVDREYIKKELSHKLDSLKTNTLQFFIGFESIQDWSSYGGKQITSGMWAQGYPKRYGTYTPHVVLLTSSAKLANGLSSYTFDGAICQKHERKHICKFVNCYDKQ
jgi:hypothetical protein